METKEDFVNQIFGTVYTVQKIYYLHNHAKNIRFIDTSEMYERRNVLKEKLQPHTLSELYQNAKQNTTDTVWDFSKLLINTKPFNEDSVRITSIFKSVVIVKQGWSEAKKSRQARKQEKRRQQKIKTIGGALYYFSSPVFDDLHQYAVISLAYHCGNVCGGECLYLFKKVNGKWENIGKTKCWIS